MTLNNVNTLNTVRMEEFIFTRERVEMIVCPDHRPGHGTVCEAYYRCRANQPPKANSAFHPSGVGK